MRFRPHRMYPGALLAQEACSYQAVTELLARIRGDLVVLIHSDRDCSNVLPKTSGRVRAHHPYKFLCTNMKEDEMVTGQGNARLRRSLELIHAAWQPGLVVVLSTCPTVMIGDNIKQVVRKAGRDLGIRVVAQLTHGLKPKSPAEVVDTLYATLCEAAPAAEGDVSRRVNLAGIDLEALERAEIEAILGRLGLQLNVVLNQDAAVEDFLRAGQAAVTIHPGPNMLLEFGRLCFERFGQRTVEVPLPYGVQATDRFWQAVAGAFGIDDATLQASLAPDRQGAIDGVAAFRQRRGGQRLKVAYNIGSVRSFDLRRIALEELGELPMLEELGCEVELLIQGPQHEENWQRTAKVLHELGVQHAFTLFPDPGGLVRFLRPGAYDLFYGARFLRDQLTQVQLPLLHHREPRLGYRLHLHNLALLQEALDDPFYKHFRAKVTSPVDAEAHVRVVRPADLVDAAALG